MTKIDAEREALLPCPFCDRAPKYHFSPTSNWIGCYDENCIGVVCAKYYKKKDTCIAVWNTRAHQPALSEEEAVEIMKTAMAKRQGYDTWEELVDSEDLYGNDPQDWINFSECYRALQSANALPVQSLNTSSEHVQNTNKIEPTAPKVTRDELMDLLEKNFGDFNKQASAIIAKWPHLVGE